MEVRIFPTRWSLAQLAEQFPVKESVTGSSPVWPACLLHMQKIQVTHVLVVAALIPIVVNVVDAAALGEEIDVSAVAVFLTN